MGRGQYKLPIPTSSRSQVELRSWLMDDHGEQGRLSFPILVSKNILSLVRAEVHTTIRDL